MQINLMMIGHMFAIQKKSHFNNCISFCHAFDKKKLFKSINK